MRPKDADRIANSVDPDQTAPLGLHCLPRPVHPKTKYHYRKFPKYSDTQKICCYHSKILTMWLYHRVMSPNDADGMANSVDPDQTAPSLIWVCTVCPGISVPKLRIVTVITVTPNFQLRRRAENLMKKSSVP